MALGWGSHSVRPSTLNERRRQTEIIWRDGGGGGVELATEGDEALDAARAGGLREHGRADGERWGDDGGSGRKREGERGRLNAAVASAEGTNAVAGGALLSSVLSSS